MAAVGLSSSSKLERGALPARVEHCGARRGEEGGTRLSPARTLGRRRLLTRRAAGSLVPDGCITSSWSALVGLEALVCWRDLGLVRCRGRRGDVDRLVHDILCGVDVLARRHLTCLVVGVGGGADVRLGPVVHLGARTQTEDLRPADLLREACLLGEGCLVEGRDSGDLRQTRRCASTRGACRRLRRRVLRRLVAVVDQVGLEVELGLAVARGVGLAGGDRSREDPEGQVERRVGRRLRRLGLGCVVHLVDPERDGLESLREIGRGRHDGRQRRERDRQAPRPPAGRPPGRLRRRRGAGLAAARRLSTGRATGSAGRVSPGISSRAGATGDATTGTLSLSRLIVTVTSENGTGIGACGLCTVTSTEATSGRSRIAAAICSATVSMRSTGAPVRMSTTSWATSA